MPNIQTFTPSSPCRCGYDGTQEFHQCHAGRHPLYPEGRCPRTAREIIISDGPAFLPGMQMKFNVAFAYYCDACALEANLKPSP